VAEALKERTEYFAAIEIEGHTDHRRPSSPTCPVRDNWQLSSERATVVLRLFAEGELPSDRLAGVGRGEHHPLVFDSTEEAYAKNRRIEVLLRYSEAGIME
jgi:chemotaxis protein MotB